MRAWYKYILDIDSEVHPVQYIGRSRSFAEHANDMGGYRVEQATYRSKEAFFTSWFYNQDRLLNFDAFLRKHLRREANILSIASGRCANELRLLDDGYRVTCSDLELVTVHEMAENLFPGFRFITLDILHSPAQARYDAVVALSLIYLFNEDDLHRFCNNVAASLNDGGMFILDSAGSPDNWLSFLLHDCWLKWEAYLLYWLSPLLKRKNYRLTVKDQGYRRTNQEIIEYAQRSGFRLTAHTDYAFLAEFERSNILLNLMNRVPLLKGLLERIGHTIPYTRMFCFIKTA